MPHVSDRRCRCTPRAARAGGFTLIEMLFTLTIVAILAGLSAPPVFGMIASQRIKLATYDFYSALAYARSQAIQRRAVVNIAPRINSGDRVSLQYGDLRDTMSIQNLVANARPDYVFHLAAQSFARRTFLSTLPTAVIGRASTNSMRLGA